MLEVLKPISMSFNVTGMLRYVYFFTVCPWFAPLRSGFCDVFIFSLRMLIKYFSVC